MHQATLITSLDFIFHPLPHLLQPINISSMPSLRVSLHRLRSQPCAVSIHPVHKLVHILNLSIFQRMEHLSGPLLLQTQLILLSHLLCCCWQDGRSCQDGSDCHGLEFKQGEGGGEEGNADEDERWVGYVEYVFVQVVDLCSVGDEYCAVRFVNGSGVAVELREEGQRHVVTGTENDSMDVGKFPAVFQNDSPRYWLQSIGQLLILYRETLKSAYLSRDASGTRREKAGGEIKGPAPGKLVYVLCFGTYLTSNVGRRDARAYE